MESITSYWNTCYQTTVIPKEPSPFAEFCATWLDTNKIGKQIVLTDLGCGNGRDSNWFASLGYKVIGVDAADLNTDNFAFEFQKQDMTTMKQMSDVWYSRFSIHAIPFDKLDGFLSNISEFSLPGAIFMIETRSIKEQESQESTENYKISFFTGPIGGEHMRVLYSSAFLCEKLKAKMFEILFCDERKGFSKLGDDDPLLIRIICKKKPYSLLKENTLN